MRGHKKALPEGRAFEELIAVLKNYRLVEETSTEH